MPVILFIVFLGISPSSFASDLLETLQKKGQNEVFLENFDLENPDLQFQLLNVLEGSSILIRVKNENGKSIGVLKFTSHNTYHRGEYAYFQLSKLFAGPVTPAAVIKKIGNTSRHKILQLIENLDFKNSRYYKRFPATLEPKERNRRELVRRLKSSQPLEAAFKEWMQGFQFYEELGTPEKLARHPLTELLTHPEREIPDSLFLIKQCSRLYKPVGCVSGQINYRHLYYDFSKILIIDAILGNRDRFPGANLHFISTDGVLNTEKSVPVRLMALDNGAVLLSRNNPALKVIKGQKIPGFKILRIPSSVQTDVENLRKAVTGPEAETVQKLLGLDTKYTFGNLQMNSWSIFKRNVEKVWAYTQTFTPKVNAKGLK